MQYADLGVGVASGLGVGAAYALLALSFSLIVAATGYFNFALESVVALGGIAAYFLLPHTNAVLAACIIGAGGALAGLVLFLVSVKLIEGRTNEVDIRVLLITIGLAIALDGGADVFFGGSPKVVHNYVPSHPVAIAGIPVPWSAIVTITIMLVVVLAMEFVLRNTALGRSLRSIQGDKEGASLLGQRVDLSVAAIFAFAAGLAGVVGLLVTPTTLASSSAGQTMLIPAFAAIALGGFGSFRGAIAGGLLIGLVQGILPLYVSPSAVGPVLFLLIIAILTWRPQGLFATNAAREV